MHPPTPPPATAEDRHTTPRFLMVRNGLHWEGGMEGPSSPAPAPAPSPAAWTAQGKDVGLSSGGEDVLLPLPNP